MQAKQAVIVIHGIGEQIPMETLRGFIDGLGFDKYFSRPDRISGNAELRRIALPAKHGSRPSIDFYELYWAHLMHRGKVYGTAMWALKLLFKRQGWLRTPIAPAMIVLSILTLLLLVGGVIAIYAAYSVELLLTQQVTIASLLVIVLCIFGLGRLSYIINNTIADAARYLTPRPANIAARAEIRKQGVELLRRLHESGEYERVVVIGHSLGSVIGYDILRTYWDEARLPDPGRSGKQDEVKAWNEVVERLPHSPTPQQIDEFQQAQHRLWREQRARGVPWLITDFITLGSPLAHARLLLTTKHSSVQQGISDRELPVCPPVGDDAERVAAGFYEQSFPHPSEAGEQRHFLVADPGAVFGPTRWTNLYFPVHRIFRGDLVGGPIAPVFGPGVEDIAVRRTIKGKWVTFWRDHFPTPHSSYWLPSEEPRMTRRERTLKNRQTGTRESNPTLKHVIDLETGRAKEPYPAPEPKRSPGV